MRQGRTVDFDQRGAGARAGIVDDSRRQSFAGSRLAGEENGAERHVRQAREKLARLAPGTRRDLMAPVSDLEVRWAGVGRLELEFSLPSGSYATEVIRQFTHSPFLIDEPDRGSDS